jgi:hypothetical protein
MGSEWFENDEGLGIEGILALEGKFRSDSLVAAVAALLEVRESRGEGLNEEQLAVLSVKTLEQGIDEGGFSPYFARHWRLVPILVRSLERIGSKEAVRLVREAVSLLKVPTGAEPEALCAAVKAALARQEVEIRLNDLDSDFYVLEEDLSRLLWAHIRANASSIAA